MMTAAAAACVISFASAALSVERGGSILLREPEHGYEVSFVTDAGTRLEAIIEPEEKYAHASASDAGTAEYTVNINTADEGELDELLPGIGRKKAAAIVEFRERVGGFGSVEELIEVEGIGPALLDKIRPYCVVSDD